MWNLTADGKCVNACFAAAALQCLLRTPFVAAAGQHGDSQTCTWLKQLATDFACPSLDPMMTVSPVNAHVVSSLMPSAVPTARGLFPQQDLCDFMHCLLQHDAVSPIANSVFGVSTRVVHHCRKCKSDTRGSGVLSPIFQVSLSDKDQRVAIHDIVKRKLQEAAAHSDLICLCGSHEFSKSVATLAPAGSHLIIAIDRAAESCKIKTGL